MTTPLLPHEMWDHIFRSLDRAALVRSAGVCRTWRAVAENIFEHLFTKEFHGHYITPLPPRSLETWRERYCYNEAKCSHFASCWKECSPQLQVIKRFDVWGQTHPLSGMLEGPISLIQSGLNSYVVRCHDKVRQVTFYPGRPFLQQITLQDWPESLGHIRHIAKGTDLFVYAEKENEKNIHILSCESVLKMSFSIPDELIALSYTKGLLVGATKGGKIRGWNDTLSPRFSLETSIKDLFWVGVTTENEETLLVAAGTEGVALYRNLSLISPMIEINLSPKPLFLQGGYLIGKNREDQYFTLHLKTGKLTYRQWSCVAPLANGQLLVQEEPSHLVLLLDPHLNQKGAWAFSSPLLALDMRRNLLLTVFPKNKVHLFQMIKNELKLCFIKPVEIEEGTQISCASLTETGIFLLGTDEGRLIHGHPD